MIDNENYDLNLSFPDPDDEKERPGDSEDANKDSEDPGEKESGLYD